MSQPPRSRPPRYPGNPKRNGQDPVVFGPGGLPEGGAPSIQFGAVDPSSLAMSSRTPPSPQQPGAPPRPMGMPGQGGYYGGPRGYPPQYGQQQQFYPSQFPPGYNPYAQQYGYYGAQGGAPPVQPAQAQQATRPRKSHALQIIDPTTGKAVELSKKGKAEEEEKEAAKPSDAEGDKDADAKKKQADEEAARKKEEEAKLKKDEAERQRKEKEDAERKAKEAKEEADKKAKEEEALKKKAEEEERLRKEKEEAERQRKEEEEKLRVEAEEKKKAEEAERLRKEEEERASKAAKEEAEKQRQQKDEEEKQKAAEAAAAAVAVTATAASAAPAEAAPVEEKSGEQQAADAGAADTQDAVDETPKPIEPPPYVAGNWSPATPDGKRIYPLDLLMAFMDLVNDRPAGMTIYPEVDRELAPSIAAARGEGREGSGRGGHRKEPLRHMNSGGAGSYRQGPGGPQGDFRGGPAGANMRREPSLGGRGGRGGRGGGGMMGGPPRGMPMQFAPGMGQGARPGMYDQLPPLPALKVGENAWRPRPVGRGDLSQLDDPEEREAVENEILFRKLKGLLNKLTMDKFARLTEQILELPIDTSTRLKGAIYIVFDKALDEPTFSPMYAQLCLKMSITMSQKEMPDEADADGKKNTFRRHLLNKCQEEFEKERQFTSEDANIAAEDRDEAMVRQKLRMLGNIKFIGELFKLKMLTDKVMHQCIVQLLVARPGSTNPAEESLESLCQLLGTIGKQLDTDKAREHMNAYFDRIKTVANSKDEVPSRIRFMLQDLLELRGSNWKPRRAEATAKTIEEVHKDMQQEAASKLARSQSSSGRNDSQRGGRGDSRGGYGGGGYGGGRDQRGGQQQTTDGWNTVGSSGRQNKQADLNSLRSLQTRAVSSGDSASMTLGPAGRGGGGARGWGQGARAAPGKESGTSAGASVNSFDILNNADTHEDRGALRPTMPTLRPQAPSPKGMRPTSPSAPQVPSPTPPVPKVGLTEEEFAKKLKTTLEEYYNAKDQAEAVTCVREFQAPEHHKLLVSTLVEAVDNKKKRPDAASLLAKLCEEGVLTKEDLVAGIEPTLDQLDDLGYDVPMIHAYMAEYLAPLAAAGHINLGELGAHAHVKRMVEDMSDAPAKMLAATFDKIKQSHDEETAKRVFSESGLKWADVLPENKKPEDFVKSMGVEFLA